MAGEYYDFRFFWKPKTLPTNGICYVLGSLNDEVAFTWVEVNDEATSVTGYTIYSVRFQMPPGSLLLQVVLTCEYNGTPTLGEVYIDDTALIRIAGCEAYPVTGSIIENPSLEIQATEDSTYAWFGTSGVSIQAGTQNANEPQPFTGNNFL